MTILSSPVQYVASTPPVTRAFAAVTVVLSLLYYWVSWSSNDPYAVPYLILVPGTSIIYPWSFFTAGLVETSLIEVCNVICSILGSLMRLLPQLVVTILVIPPSLRYFERLWGTAETIKFIAVTIVASNIIAFGLSWIEYFVFQNPAFAWVQPCYVREKRLTLSQFRDSIPWSDGFASRHLGCLYSGHSGTPDSSFWYLQRSRQSKVQSSG